MCSNVDLNADNKHNYLSFFISSVNLWPCGHVCISKFPGDTMRAITRWLANSVVVWECCYFILIFNFGFKPSSHLTLWSCVYMLNLLQKTTWIFYSDMSTCDRVFMWPCQNLILIQEVVITRWLAYSVVVWECWLFI